MENVSWGPRIPSELVGFWGCIAESQTAQMHVENLLHHTGFSDDQLGPAAH